MARLIIRGGKRLSGVHKPPGNKNAALPMLAAAVLTDEPVRLRNIPLIDDVFAMLEILDDLGADVSLKDHTVTVHAAGLRKRRLRDDLCKKVRSSILFAGPMAARHGRVTLFPPGGDVIGRRRLDTHFDGLRRLGIRVHGNHHYSFRRGRLAAADILLDEAGVTATENILMAAVLAPGVTTLFNAACEPHVQDLCAMLNRMGARIHGIGTNFLRIRGVESLHGVRHRVAPDYIDACSFIAAAAVTGGSLRIPGAAPGLYDDVVARPFRKLGVRWRIRNGALRLPPGQRLKVRDDFGAAIPKIEDGVWPNFPSDLMSLAVVVATQAEGSVLFFEKMFESRMYFADRLIAMGARIVQCDPHRVLVAGPARLHGIHMSSPDIRAGMALVLAALCARGESVIENAQSIDRGYERVEQELRRLGADITRVE
ncbi:MAG: UDP-N-acetylglucosamine 1-carboxyvinyltransferase [Verrucomicrobiota bacterium]|nr:UDP-N-acetylglucosamine 1-carboxyvinyltransferase [Verrucomicrobiota bacterium]